MIETILASLVNFPSWLIYGLVGAALGGLGGFLGAILQKFIPLPQMSSILAVVGAALSVQVTKLLVIPEIITASMNADLPKKADDVTTIVRIDYDGRRYRYQYELADVVPADVDAETLRSGLLSQLCEHWRPQFLTKEVAGADYNYQLHGQTLSFTIEPSDCP